jgi:hypothetical protein
MGKYVGNVFLKVDDIKANGPIRVKITDVSEGRFGKPDLRFDDGTQLSLNATNARVLAHAYGLESEIDRQVELALGEVEYQGKPQEAILVKPVSPSSKKPELDDEIPL